MKRLLSLITALLIFSACLPMPASALPAYEEKAGDAPVVSPDNLTEAPAWGKSSEAERKPIPKEPSSIEAQPAPVGPISGGSDAEANASGDKPQAQDQAVPSLNTPEKQNVQNVLSQMPQKQEKNTSREVPEAEDADEDDEEEDEKEHKRKKPQKPEEDDDEEPELTFVKGKPAACLEAGQKDHYRDESGNLYLDDKGENPVSAENLTLPPLGHSWGETTYQWNEDHSACEAARACTRDPSHRESAAAEVTVSHRAPTCDAPGELTYHAGFSVSWTKDQQVTVLQGDPTGHNWEAPTYIWSADGSSCRAQRICKNDQNHMETLDALVIREQIRKPDCEHPGESVCRAYFVSRWASPQTKKVTDLPALGHDWQDTSYIWSPDGSRCQAIRVCRRDPSHRETMDAVITESTIPASCEAEGKVIRRAEFPESWAQPQQWTVEVLPALGHDFGTPSYQWSEDHLSCQAVRICTHDESHRETAEALVTREVTAEASCETPGEITYKAEFSASWAETQTVTEKDGAALGHDWQEPVYTWSPDGSSCQAVRICKRDPAHRETLEAVITSDITRQPSCDAAGETTFHAEFEGTWAEPQERKTANLPALGHDWLEPSYLWNPDGSSCQAVRTCSRDPRHRETIEAEIRKEVQKAPGCETPGETAYTAVFEAPWASPQKKVISDIPALGHDFREVTYEWNEDHSECRALRVCERDPSHQQVQSGVITKEVTRAPGCDTVGETTYRAVFPEAWGENQEVTLSDVPPLGHEWGNPTYQWSEDGRSCRAVRFCRRNPNHYETATAYVTSYVSKAPGCETGGTTTYQAGFDCSWAEPQVRTVSNLPALGHDYGEITYQWSEDGKSCTAVRTCQRDPSHVQRETAKMTARQSLDPTEDRMGETTYYAVFSSLGETQMRTVADIPMLPSQLEEQEPPEVLEDGALQAEPLLSEEGKPGLQISVSIDYLEEFAKQAHKNGEEEGITFTCGKVSINYNLTALDSILRQAEHADSVSISIENQEPDAENLTERQLQTTGRLPKGELYGVELLARGAARTWEIHDFEGGQSKVTLPYHRSQGFRVGTYRVEKDGSLTEVPCTYDPETDTLIFETPSHSSYVILPRQQDLVLVWALAGVLSVILAVILIENRKNPLELTFLFF